MFFIIDVEEEVQRALNGETDVVIENRDFAKAVLENADGTK